MNEVPRATGPVLQAALNEEVPRTTVAVRRVLEGRFGITSICAARAVLRCDEADASRSGRISDG